MREAGAGTAGFALRRLEGAGRGTERPGLNGNKLERAMMSLAGEVAGIDENDPRQMARFMRKLTEATGMNLGSGMEEAIHLLETGEDPERIEEKLGDLFDEENPFAGEGGKVLKRKFTPPASDDTLYVL
jgi:hypothetical protein